MKKQKLFTIIIALMIVSLAATAQWNTSGSDIYNSNIGGVSVGTAGAADPDALLEIKSTTKGILIPRMTKTQRDAIPTPITAGLLIYQTNSTPGFYYYDGSVWVAVTPKAGASKT
ncbi:MAG TPA: hypothetical protein VE978_07620, partial [Chitinophagales bacterium]|nr:hypothetical protein [Chitinophagales bacterium]